MTNRPSSAALFARAQELFPGGVNSPVRAFNAVGGSPVFIERGEGAFVFGADGERYLDFLGSWGPLILGHAPAAVQEAIKEAAAQSTTFGASTRREIELGEAIQSAFPSMERMRFVSSGTEATMSALRLARGYTGRSKIIKVDGGYHGHADMLLAAAGSGAATLGIPGSDGVTASAVADTLLVPYNDTEALDAALSAHAGDVAAFIVEPVPGNMGLVLPEASYLESVRALCDKHEALLIFDEVISGFRVSRGGAQGHYGVYPDMTCLGKIVGGGLPMGVYGGRADIIDKVAPVGPVYQAGTLSGNPLAMAAGLATLQELTPELYARIDRLGARFEAGLINAIQNAQMGGRVHVRRLGSALTVFFCAGPVRNFADAKGSDTKQFGRFFHEMLDRGVYLPPAQFEAGFVSGAHQEEDIDTAIAAATEAFAALASS